MSFDASSLALIVRGSPGERSVITATEYKIQLYKRNLTIQSSFCYLYEILRRRQRGSGGATFFWDRAYIRAAAWLAMYSNVVSLFSGLVCSPTQPPKRNTERDLSVRLWVQ